MFKYTVLVFFIFQFDEDLPLDVFLDDDMDDFTDAVGLNCSNSTATTLPLQSQNGSCVNTHPPKVTKVSIVNRNNITSLNSNINNQFPHQDKYVQMSSLRQSLPRASVQQEDVTNMNFVEEDFDDDFDMSDFTNSRTKLDTNEKLQVGITKKRQLISPVDNQNCKRRSYVSNSDVGEYIRPDVSAADQWKGPVLNMKLEGGIVSGRSDVDIDINIEVAPSPENNTNKEGWKCLLQEGKVSQVLSLYIINVSYNVLDCLNEILTVRKSCQMTTWVLFGVVLYQYAILLLNCKSKIFSVTGENST